MGQPRISGSRPMGPTRILLVDDHPGNARAGKGGLDPQRGWDQGNHSGADAFDQAQVMAGEILVELL